ASARIAFAPRDCDSISWMRRPAGPRSRSRSRPRRDRPRILRLRMTSRRDAVAPTIDRILEAVTPAGLDGDRLTDLAVALADALAKAAVRGHRLDPQRRVAVAVSVSRGCVVVDVSDSGGGFDARGVRDPTAPEGRLATGGRGIFLMRRLVDEVSYNRA